MILNPLDSTIINEIQKAGGRKALVKKMVRKVGGAAGSAATGVSNAVGAGPMVDYAGAKMAKAKVPVDMKNLVSDTTSGKAAFGSAVKAGSIALSAPLAYGAVRGISALSKVPKVAKSVTPYLNTKLTGEAIKSKTASMANDAFSAARDLGKTVNKDLVPGIKAKLLKKKADLLK